MANASNLPYLPENFTELEPIIKEAAEAMAAAPKLKARVIRALSGNDHAFSNEFQIDSNDTQRHYTFQELIDSYKNETDLQRIDPESVRTVLFGPNGMIRRRGGGSPSVLMEDIEVGFIIDRLIGVNIGPVMTSGRNRLIALQVFIKAAAPNALLEDVKIRCYTRKFNNRKEMADRIVQANSEPRNMSRAETRERKAGATGLVMSSREELADSLQFVQKVGDQATAFGGFVRLCAIEHNLDGLTLDQFAAAGVTAYGKLRKANRDLGREVKETPRRLADLAETACGALPQLVGQAVNDNGPGPKNSKLARLLADEVAKRHHLLIQR